MRLILLFTFLLSTPLFANSQITELLNLAEERSDFSEDMRDRIAYEVERWKAPKHKQRFFWREIVMQTHLDPLLKDYALNNWIDLSQEIGYSMQDFEDLAVYAHYQILQSQLENNADHAERWSWMIEKLQNQLSNMDDSKEKSELIKVLKIRIDPKIIDRFI